MFASQVHALERDLRILVDCHGTPGDEDEVARVLRSVWSAAGWRLQTHGRYAISAQLPGRGVSGPTLLVCAHMDSPGFTVQSIHADRCGVIALGQPRIEGPSAEVVLKTQSAVTSRPVDGSDRPGQGVSDRSWVVLQKSRSKGAEAPYWIPSLEGIQAGDRLCFHGTARIDSDGTVRAPFLDNRFGCAVLCELARRWSRRPPPFRVVLGATAGEELGSIGAPVLANAVRPDAVVCIDATYESCAQEVILGGGPVLTLSDASVVLGCRQRDHALAFAERAGVSLQTEVYNVSGTDSRSFPAIGLEAPVYALLLPTRDNHCAVETGHLDDARHVVDLLLALSDESMGAEWFLAGFGLD